MSSSGDRGQNLSLLPPQHIIHLPKLPPLFLFFSQSVCTTLSLPLSGQCHDLPSARCGVEMKPARTKLALAKAHMSVGALQLSGAHQTGIKTKIKAVAAAVSFSKKTCVCYVTEIVICFSARPFMLDLNTVTNASRTTRGFAFS